MEVKTFRDHHLYSQEDLNNLVSLSKEQDAVLLTTEKDWMRIQENPLWSSFSVFVLPMEVRINDEEVLWKEIREVQKRM